MKHPCVRGAAVSVLALALVLLPCSVTFRNPLTAENLNAAGKEQRAQGNQAAASQAPVAASKEKPAKRDEAMERETALTMKERELKRLGENIDSRIKEMDETRKVIDASLAQKKTQDAERYKKMLKIYKSLRPEAAAKLIDKLDEDVAFEMLNQMDQKTASKLIPFLNQERVLKWTRVSLKGK